MQGFAQMLKMMGVDPEAIMKMVAQQLMDVKDFVQAEFKTVRDRMDDLLESQDSIHERIVNLETALARLDPNFVHPDTSSPGEGVSTVDLPADPKLIGYGGAGEYDGHAAEKTAEGEPSDSAIYNSNATQGDAADEGDKASETEPG